MENRVFLFLLVLTLGFSLGNVSAAEADGANITEETSGDAEAPLEEPLITPTVKRNKIKLARIDTEDFLIGIFGGSYSIEDFGVHPVYGARVGLLLTETFFIDATMGFSKAGPSSAEKLFNFDLLTEQERELVYYDVSVGYNLFPGEAFMGDDTAFVTTLYVSVGAGSTQFAGDDYFTLVGGIGYRIVLTDWMAAQVDFRDHIFESDIMGDAEIKHNIEYTIGASWFF